MNHTRQLREELLAAFSKWAERDRLRAAGELVDIPEGVQELLNPLRDLERRWTFIDAWLFLWAVGVFVGGWWV